jgi:hypothetical protein
MAASLSRRQGKQNKLKKIRTRGSKKSGLSFFNAELTLKVWVEF